MCTIGYHKKDGLVFKNRDKYDLAINEVVEVKPDLIAVKTEGADYFSTGVNRYGCAFVSAAVNTPLWTSLVIAGEEKKACDQFKKENEGLVNPMGVISKYLPNVKSVDEWLKILLNHSIGFMGYNVILVDKESAVHIELHHKKSHMTKLKADAVVTNHFHNLTHGPKAPKDYPSSFRRLEFARHEIRNAVTMEDIFQLLKTQNSDSNSDIWRKGAFSTVSSSVIDVETRALYYCSEHEQPYARVAAQIPPKGAERVFMEMSRYIDLPTYHNIERGHPFYVEMIEEIKSQVQNYYDSLKRKGRPADKLTTLELGAGTGLCTLDLAKFPFLNIDALDIDSECCRILSSHPEASRYNVILDDAVTYCKQHHYDLVVSTFAHDHIHYNKRFAFAANIYNNLKKGGIYIMGGEILPYFSNDLERKKSTFRYHNYIIDLALQHNRVQLSELENNALKSGLDMVGDFKRHEAMFEEEMKSADFECLMKKKMGPLDKDDVGGVFVYVFKAV